MSAALTLALPPELVEAIAKRSAAIVLERLRQEPSPRWLYGAKAAADYLGCPVKRVNNLVATAELPHHRTGGRLMFSTADLDRYVTGV